MYEESSDDETKHVNREIRKYVLPAPYVRNDRDKDDGNFQCSQSFHKTSKTVVSKDGRTATVTQTGTTIDGKPVNNKIVIEKQ